MSGKSIRACCVATLLVLALLAGDSARSACSYFAARDKDINQPGQKAFIVWDPEARLEAFTVQPKFEGNAIDFGMVIPTPSRPKLDEMPRDFFKDLAIYTILMPLPEPIWAELRPVPPAAAAFGGASRGAVRSKLKDSVQVLEAGVVGSLDYKIIVAEDARGLFEWLRENGYSYAGDEATLEHYIKKSWFFTVMKIDPNQMKKAADGTYAGEVTPTRFTFRSDACIYPLKITSISVKDTTDALFYVQAPAQMDLPGQMSWRPSFRSMYLTFLVGCGATKQENEELQFANRWIADLKARQPKFETTKLEWAQRLGKSEMAVLDDPTASYAQMGTGELPPGAKVISLAELLKELREAGEKDGKKLDEYARNRLTQMEDRFQPSKGIIVKNPETKGTFTSAPYMWYPNREAPEAEVKGLTRLRGHLKSGEWLTKFRRIIRKDEMTDDLVLSEVPKEKEQAYVRILPTSPP